MTKPALSTSTAAPAAFKVPQDSFLEALRYRATWFTTIVFIFFTALMMNFVQVLAFPFYYLNVAWYRKWIQIVGNSYSKNLTFLLEWKSGMRTLYYGDASELFKLNPPSAIYVSNHTSYADWVVFFTMFTRFGDPGVLRVFLKDLAKVLPGIGWACYMSDFFLVKKSATKGNWGKDGAVIVDRLKSYRDMKSPIVPAIFPEGTFHDGAVPNLVEKTQEFARTNGLNVLDYLLVPRARGFVACVQNLRGHAEYIIDQTIAFSGNTDPTQIPFDTAKPLSDDTRVMPDAVHMVAYRAPKFAHVHIRLIPLSEVPEDEEGIKKFLFDMWDHKEQLLKNFHRTGSFEGKPLEVPLNPFGPAAGGGGFLFLHVLMWLSMVIGWFFLLAMASKALLLNALLVIVGCTVAGILVEHFWKDK